MRQDAPDSVVSTQSVRAVYASRPDRSRGRLHREPESPTRTVFQRDRDRIIHSGGFRKLQHKTQVFVHHEGDYYRSRLTHSIEVGQIARSIARILGLDEDLAEAVALAHDLGHTPFGHAGEDALDACMGPYGGFDHNDQALRVVTRLEARYAEFDGLNLTWETLEGLVKHNGPLFLSCDQGLPVTIAEFQKEFDLEIGTYASAEAQVAALSDDIAYITHDLDDGLRAAFFSLDELAELPLIGDMIGLVNARHPALEAGRAIHEATRRLIDFLVRDLLSETRRRLAELRPDSVEAVRASVKPVVSLSSETLAKDKLLRQFLMERLYRDYRVNRMTSKARRIMSDLFAHFMGEPETLPSQWQRAILTAGGSDRARARTIADYLAGMTDRYAIAEHRRIFDLHEPNQ